MKKYKIVMNNNESIASWNLREIANAVHTGKCGALNNTFITQPKGLKTNKSSNQLRY